MIKSVMKIVGLDSGKTRLPNVSLSIEEKNGLEKIIENIKI